MFRSTCRFCKPFPKITGIRMGLSKQRRPILFQALKKSRTDLPHFFHVALRRLATLFLIYPFAELPFGKTPELMYSPAKQQLQFPAVALEGGRGVFRIVLVSFCFKWSSEVLLHQDFCE